MAPNLQQIRIVDNMLMEYEVHEMQSIQQATLDVKHWESDTVDPQRAYNLVEGVAKTSRLILSSGVLLVSILILYQQLNIHLQHWVIFGCKPGVLG